MVNFNAVLLRVAMPVVEKNKLAELEWSFLSWSAGYFSAPNQPPACLFPLDAVKMYRANSEEGVGGAADQSLLLPPPNSSEYKFFSQSFFACMRLMHLGLVQECIKYNQVVRGLSHYHHELASNGQQGMAYLVRKVTMDAAMLNTTTLIGVYCTSLALSAMGVTNPPPSGWCPVRVRVCPSDHAATKQALRGGVGQGRAGRAPGVRLDRVS